MANVDKMRYISLFVSIIGFIFSVYLLFKHNFEVSNIIILILWLVIIVKDVTCLKM